MSYRLGAEVTLDQIDDWFKIKIGKVVPKTVSQPRSRYGGRAVDPLTGDLLREPGPFVPPYKRHGRQGNPNQTAYASHYKEMEEEDLYHSTASARTPSPGSRPLTMKNLVGGHVTIGRGMKIDPKEARVGGHSPKMEELESQSYISGLTSLAPPEDLQPPPRPPASYESYTFKHDYDPNLPITKHQETIVDVIESNQVTVIQGLTGSGKTTQVPQFILDHYAQQNKYCNIIVTQPRRIAAQSIARRVCSERGWSLGSTCGYQIAMDKVGTSDTKIWYVTTGVLKAKLISAKNMDEYTHVILDEVHEREQTSDLTLLVAKKLLRTVSRHVKVILMSATFDSDLFANYFAVPVLGRLEAAPVVDIEGRYYTVAEYYLENIRKLGGEMPILKPDEPLITNEAKELTRKLIMKFDEMEMSEQKTVSPSGFAPKRGSVLAFVPGLAEIEDLINCLNQIKEKHQLIILPLHSTITLEEQSRVFEQVAPGKRKVILSTNIAESSITVPDIKYVIDFCLTKNLQCDPDTNYTALKMEWASKANATQRKGRAGRVSSGRVYRMVTKRFYEDILPEYGTPEMQRCPLEKVILEVKLLDLGEPKAILGLALSPPNLDDIERTILLLKEVGALATPRSGAINPHDGDLTFVGKVLAKLPVDIRIGKLIVLGHVFGKLEECLIIGAALSQKSFFARPWNAELDIYRAKLEYANGTFSDCLAFLNAYQAWEQKRQSGWFHRSGRRGDERSWCKNNMIQPRPIREVEVLVKDLKMRLSEFNIRTPRVKPKRLSMAQELLILKVVLCGAFYPNYFNHCPNDEKDAIRTMSGRDPDSTIMLKNLPTNQGMLYKGIIMDMFDCCVKDRKFDGRIHFEETKAYVEFKRHHTPDSREEGLLYHKTLPEIYMAVKMRQLRRRLEIELIDAEEVRQRMSEIFTQQDKRSSTFSILRTNRVKAISDKQTGTLAQQVSLPAPNMLIITILITHLIECGHFWCQYADSEATANIHDLQMAINGTHGGRNLKAMTSPPTVGGLCLAPYEDEYYRARIERIFEGSVELFFLDYGNTESVPIHSLRHLSENFQELPFQAMECYLSGIRPSALRCSDGHWSKEALDVFIRHVENKTLFARVYSVVHNALRIELIDRIVQRGFEVNINQLLYDKGFADKAEESYASKKNHQDREDRLLERKQSSSNTKNGQKEDDDRDGEPEVTPTTPVSPHTPDDIWLDLSDDSDRKYKRKGIKVTLHGPYSPIELSYHSMTSIGRMRGTRITRESVNSVALDEEPQDRHQRLMVAAHVGLNPGGNMMMARDTTLLPNIHGLYVLMPLLFAPTVELRTDSKRKMYIGALCGLGWDPDTRGSALPDHDMELTFDVHIDNKDIAMINNVKMAINFAIGSEETSVDWGPEAIARIQEKARHKLIELLEKRRDSIELHNFSRPYMWNEVSSQHILENRVDSEIANNPDLLNLLKGINIDDDITEDDSNYQQLRCQKRLHIQWLHSKITNIHSPLVEDVYCELCDIICRNQRELIKHLNSKTHIDEEGIYL